MERLAYTPNSVARALVTGRSNTIGVVSFDTTLYGPVSTLLAIERAAHDAGYFIIIASVKLLDRASVADAVERLRRHRVDGILVIAPQQSAVDALEHVPANVPLVAVEAGPRNRVPVVMVDQRAGAVMATKHLLSLGHQTVWHVGGPRDFLESRERAEAWRRTLRQAGADTPAPVEGDWSAQSGYELGKRLTRERKLSAIFVANDQMALGVLRAMHEAGRAIPQEVSVVGFDDIPEAPFFTPPLTTIRQHFGEMGARGLRLLVRIIEAAASGVVQQRPPREPRVQPELIVRSSTAPPPSMSPSRQASSGRGKRALT
jgi:DNA-binding LacI/PurR family transcriptional regulator